MILLLTIVLSGCNGLDNWIQEYKNDPRPFCPTDLDANRLNGRIVGGKDAGEGTFPFGVGIAMGGTSESRVRADNTFCAGTLITDQHVLTAAHCLYNYLPFKDSLWMNVNDYDTLNPNERRNYLRGVKSIYVHPRYADSTFNNDIAIITMKSSIPLDDDVRMAILPPLGRKLEAGTMCTVWGWGRLSYDGRRATVMQKVDVPITSRRDCQMHLEHRITENMICAGGREGQDACLGDSGGSLLSRDGNVYTLAGIVSFGRGCAQKGVSGVYTNVARYTDLIYEETRTASCKPRLFE